MSKNNETITGGLGIREEYFETASNRAKKKLQDLDTISEALEAVAEEIRDEEFGESNLRVSDYEKKLVLSGFIMGCLRAEAQMSHKMEELKLVFHLMSMSKKVGKGEDGSDIFGGMINAGDLPKELRDLLEKLSGEKGEDD